MGKYIPPEKMTEAQIRAELDCEFQHWNDLANGACCDPGWPDGINMNLVRNHIIYWYRLLADRAMAEVQLSLFDSELRMDSERQIPPEVPDRYMVKGGKHSDRLKDRGWPNLVWGRKGEYHA